MEDHILNDWPEAVINCSFIGCKKKVKRKLLEDHCQKDWRYHLQQSNAVIKKLSEQFENLSIRLLLERMSTYLNETDFKNIKNCVLGKQTNLQISYEWTNMEAFNLFVELLNYIPNLKSLDLKHNKCQDSGCEILLKSMKSKFIIDFSSFGKQYWIRCMQGHQ